MSIWVVTTLDFNKVMASKIFYSNEAAYEYVDGLDIRKYEHHVSYFKVDNK